MPASAAIPDWPRHSSSTARDRSRTRHSQHASHLFVKHTIRSSRSIITSNSDRIEFDIARELAISIKLTALAACCSKFKMRLLCVFLLCTKSTMKRAYVTKDRERCGAIAATHAGEKALRWLRVRALSCNVALARDPGDKPSSRASATKQGSKQQTKGIRLAGADGQSRQGKERSETRSRERESGERHVSRN